MTTPRETQQPFLSLHTAVVLVIALLIGGVVGGPSFLGGVPVALSALAGLTATGGAVPVLRGLIF
ncbi:hypothetical protein ACIQU4_35675 [Streptomyces sp. NPDC090741]|uniref:hypothetical protein n=1 Tax=Streptomyces sp. NPDC090741 TaxID=3365967 RepID=UPI0038302B5C